MAESKHKTPLLGWHPTSAGRSAWVRSEAQRRGMKLSAILDEMLTEYWERRTTGNHPSANHREPATDPPATGNHAGEAAPEARRRRKPRPEASPASLSVPAGPAPSVAGTEMPAEPSAPLPEVRRGKRDECPHGYVRSGAWCKPCGRIKP